MGNILGEIRVSSPLVFQVAGTSKSYILIVVWGLEGAGALRFRRQGIVVVVG